MIRRISFVGSAVLLAWMSGCGSSNNPGFDGDAGDDGGATTDDAGGGGGGGKDGGGGGELDSGGGGDAATGDGSFCSTHADGTACGDTASSDCDKPDTCKGGVCVQNLTAQGTTCGGTPTECTDQSTCDGQGHCQGTPKPQGTACGSATTSECDLADTCNATGTCLPNHVAMGTACGSAATSACDNADTCDNAGACQPNHVADNTACGSASSTSCDMPDTCLSGVCASNNAANGGVCSDCPSGIGKCGVCATGACPDLCTTPTATTLTTTFAAGNGQNGNMFDVVGVKDAMVIGATVNADAAASFEIYTRPDTVVGHDTSATGWTLVASPTTAASGQTPLVGAFFIPITASATTGFYITSTNSGVSYTNGTSVGNVAASDTFLSVLEGYGKSYPFGSTFSPRIWNGTFSYAPGTTTSYAGASSSDGEMFDVTASADANVRAVSVNLDPGSYQMHVYFHQGTHVGVEGTQAAWTSLGSVAVTSLAAAAPTAVPLALNVTIPSGKTYAFYVTTEGGATQVKDAAGTAVGNTISTANNITVKEGTGVAYPFGTKTTPRVFNGTVYVSGCN